MAFAPARVTPFVMQRLQVPVQVLIYAGLFVCADYFVNWLHLPLPANLVGMLMMLTLIVCRVIPLNWVRAGAAGRDAAVLRAGGSGGRQLRATADGGGLAHLSGDWLKYHDGAGRDGMGG